MCRAVALEHVIVLCLENRSFDHMLGFLPHPDPTFEGLRGPGPFSNPTADGGLVEATPTAKPVLPFGPNHCHDAVMQQLDVRRGIPTNQGFVTSYELTASGRSPTTRGGVLGKVLGPLLSSRRSRPPVVGRGPLVMRCQNPDSVPVLSTLALQFAVCDHWFSSVPGETWPNRNFLHAATSDGETNIEIDTANTDRHSALTVDAVGGTGLCGPGWRRIGPHRPIRPRRLGEERVA
jgi:phospholipase C